MAKSNQLHYIVSTCIIQLCLAHNTCSASVQKTVLDAYLVRVKKLSQHLTIFKTYTFVTQHFQWKMQFCQNWAPKIELQILSFKNWVSKIESVVETTSMMRTVYVMKECCRDNFYDAYCIRMKECCGDNFYDAYCIRHALESREYEICA